MIIKTYLLPFLFLCSAGCDNDAEILEAKLKLEAEHHEAWLAKIIPEWEKFRAERCGGEVTKVSLYKRFPNFLISASRNPLGEDQNISNYITKAEDYRTNISHDYADIALHRKFNKYIRQLFNTRIEIIKKTGKYDRIEFDSAILNLYLASSINIYTQSGDYHFIRNIFNDLDNAPESKKIREDAGSSEVIFTEIRERRLERDSPFPDTFANTEIENMLRSSYLYMPDMWNIASALYAIEVLKNEKKVRKSLESAMLKTGLLYDFNSADEYIDLPSVFKNDYTVMLSSNGICLAAEAPFIWEYTAFNAFKQEGNEYSKISKSIFEQSNIID